eukprot:gene2168-2668_t
MITNIEQENDKGLKEDFVDLNPFRGLGEDLVYKDPVLIDRPRFWNLKNFNSAPRDLGYSTFGFTHWKGVHLLKDPDTQVAYQNIMWALKPKTIIELGVFCGGSLIWLRDMARSFGFNCQLIGVDINLSRCQIPKSEMENISLYEANCNHLDQFSFLKDLQHPILFIDDAHHNTFNVIAHFINNFLKEGDYVIIEDCMPLWKRYSPNGLTKNLAAFNHYMALDLLYSNSAQQLQDGVFKVLKSGKK